MTCAAAPLGEKKLIRAAGMPTRERAKLIRSAAKPPDERKI